MLHDATQVWTISDASELYEVPRWSNGYFSINASGHVQVHPDRDSAHGIDLKELVDRLLLRGIDLPILIRFNGIIEDRLRTIHNVFSETIAESEYTGNYACVYPIKVNQQRQVVEAIVRYGSRYGFGLEAGSKPEMLAVVAMTDPDTPIICNGFKDAEFIEMAMLAQKMGRLVIPVVERFAELDLIIKAAEAVGVRPQIGMRTKLATRGSGRWQSSGGYRSKFGLTASEILKGFEHLQALGMADCLQLLHFHMGSQITNIRVVKAALVEASRIYVDLALRGAGLKYLDVGGGLGVDYDGSQTNFESSMNYTLREYAHDVINHVKAVCDDAGVAHPNIISESGRALVAYHSVLVFDALGVSGQGNGYEAEKKQGSEASGSEKSVPDLELLSEDSDEFRGLSQPLRDMILTSQSLTARNVQEGFHAAQEALDTALTLFSTGHLPLDERCQVESMYWSVLRRIRQLISQLEFVPEELSALDRWLADTYFCNFSLFQSLPDSWAIKQLFPVMPIHRLSEAPTRHAVLGDITCDSDGKIDQFIDRRDVRRTLLLHPFHGQPYYLGAFLTGAYQEILGDLHNLFGDTNAVHVSVDDQHDVVLETIIKGDTVAQVLDYVEFNQAELVSRLQGSVEVAVRQGRLSHEEAGYFLRFYEQKLNGYTYLS